MGYGTRNKIRVLQMGARLLGRQSSAQRDGASKAKNQLIFTRAFRLQRPSGGFTLVETVVAVAIVAMVTLAIYQAYALVFKLIHDSREKTAALELASERVEQIRNLPYASIGISGGLPAGVLPRISEYVRGGILFQATTTVRNVDDAFDGQIGGTPNDLSPADYKIVELEIGCKDCRNFTPIIVTTTAAPRSLETTSGNGALFVSVMDANGNPVSGAEVVISSISGSPLTISDVTNNQGELQVVDIPPGAFEYSVNVSKSGYSSEQTYEQTVFSPAVPVNSHPTVAAGALTQLSLAIDRVSNLNIKTVNEACAAVPNVGFILAGTKNIAIGPPDVRKTTVNSNTGAGGSVTISNLEWDSYDLSLEAGKLIAGTIPLFPLDLAPNATQDVYILPVDDNPNSLLVTVKDTVTGLQVSDATVTLTKTGFSESKVTNRGFWSQTDWSGGDGQEEIGASDRFASTDGNVEYASTPGTVSLKDILGSYAASGSIISSWFDFNQSTTTLYSITSLPVSQPSTVGVDSVRFQIETADDMSSAPGIFLGPDGTTGTFYGISTTSVNSIHTNQRYVRYRMYLSTEDPLATPVVSDVFLSFGTECTPFGQVYFEGLDSGSYDLEVSAPGYVTSSGIPVTISGLYQTATVSLTQ